MIINIKYLFVYLKNQNKYIKYKPLFNKLIQLLTLELAVFLKTGKFQKFYCFKIKF